MNKKQNPKLNSKRILKGIVNNKGQLESWRNRGYLVAFKHKGQIQIGAIGTKKQILNQTKANPKNITFIKPKKQRQTLSQFLSRTHAIDLKDVTHIEMGGNIIALTEKVPGPHGSTEYEQYRIRAKTEKTPKKKNK